MRELILNMSLSLDGFVSGANGEIDWIFSNSTEESRDYAAGRLTEMGLHLMGRKSYEMADFWPTAGGPFAKPMNEIPKAVFSRSGTVPEPAMEKTRAAVAAGTVDAAVMESWLRPVVAGKDLVADIQRLKGQEGGPINALGGASFASSLIEANLVDVFHFVVHPVALGQGLPIFAGLQEPLHLRLEDLKQFSSGIVIKTLRPV